jgi:hypothetical protein
MTLSQKVEEILLLAGRPMSVRQLFGALREMFAVNPTRAELRRACFETASLKRGGSNLYYLDHDLRADRLWRELMAIQ